MSPLPTRNGRRRRNGLSTIEMVTAIVVTGVLSVGLAGILRHPMQGYSAVSRRAELVDLAELALQRMSRDLRMALPNSVRVGADGTAIELLHVVAGGRYRAEPGINPNGRDHTDASDWLSFGGDDRFNLLGRISDFSFEHGTALPAGTRVAIYPASDEVWHAAASDADPGVVSASTNRIVLLDDGDEDQIALATSHRFSLASPRSRLYLVDGPVSYVCDAASAALVRVERYAVASVQPEALDESPLAAGARARASDHVESCRFEYLPGTPSRSGLVTISLVLESEGERVRLLQQVPIPNAP